MDDEVVPTVAGDSEKLTLKQAQREYHVRRATLSGLPVTPGPRGAKLLDRADVERLIASTGRCSEADKLTIPDAAREYGVPPKALQSLPFTPAPRRSRLVNRADVEQLIADSRCEECRKPCEPGRGWHRSCRPYGRSKLQRQQEMEQLEKTLGRRGAVHVANELHVTNRSVLNLRRRLERARGFPFGLQVEMLSGPPRWFFTDDEMEQMRAAIAQGAGPKISEKWAAAKQQPHDTAEEELFDVTKAAQQLGRSDATVYWWADKLGVGTRKLIGPSRKVLMFTTPELKRLREAIASAIVVASNDPERRPGWYRTSFSPSNDSPVAGRINGKLGGRPMRSSLDLAVQDEINVFNEAGLSYRQIAGELGDRGRLTQKGKKITKDHVAYVVKHPVG